MHKDVLLDFYLASTKVHCYESHLCNDNLSEDECMDMMREVDLARRELGAVLNQLLNSAIPSCLRADRRFRLKYTEEIDLRNLERCLVSAANKVHSFDPATAPRDIDLRPAKPAATAFLDLLCQVQSLVLFEIDRALSVVDNHLLSGTTNHSKWHSRTEVSAGSPTTSESTSISDASPATSEESKVNCTPSRSTVNSPVGRSSEVTFTRVVLKLGSRHVYESFRLPPPTHLTVSDELLSVLYKLDESCANFEFDFVKSFTRKIRSLRQADDLQFVTVLFSETLMWAIAVRLLTVQQLADRDPAVMLCLPRLAVLVGVRLLPDSPIGANRLCAGRRLPFVFSPFRADLAYLARQLNALRFDQLCRLTRWLGPRGLPNLLEAKPGSSNTMDTVNSGQVWRTNLAGLHRVFKRISSVADGISVMFPTELRLILQSCIEMHDTSNHDIALAEMEGRDITLEEEEEDPATHTETEVDSDVPLSAITEHEKFNPIAKLFRWSEVVREVDTKQCLSDALKEWCVDRSAGPLKTFPVCEVSEKERDFPFELGFDVTSGVGGLDLSDRSTSPSGIHTGRSTGPFSLDNLSLGISVRGEHTDADRLVLSHLAPWQPDHGWRDQNVVSDSTGESDTDDDADEDDADGPDDDNHAHRRRRFVVGQHCAHCLQSFTVFRRRHHCRRCGHIFCFSCCNQRERVDGLATKHPVRVCVECRDFLDTKL